jgi:nucleoside phosphorylase
MGKAEQDGIFRRTGAFNNSSSLLLSALTTLESETEINDTKIPEYFDKIKQDWPLLAAKYLRLNYLQNVLFKANYSHMEKQHSNASEEGDDESEDDAEKDCRHCDKTQIIKRKPRNMRVHYGLIASGNQMVKDASFRNQLLKDINKKVFCVEIKAAGLMDNFSCIIIRGICDYANSHKNKAWQEHAAAVAAAFAKELLGYIQPQKVDEKKTIKDVLA